MPVFVALRFYAHWVHSSQAGRPGYLPDPVPISSFFSRDLLMLIASLLLFLASSLLNAFAVFDGPFGTYQPTLSITEQAVYANIVSAMLILYLVTMPAIRVGTFLTMKSLAPLERITARANVCVGVVAVFFGVCLVITILDGVGIFPEDTTVINVVGITAAAFDVLVGFLTLVPIYLHLRGEGYLSREGKRMLALFVVGFFPVVFAILRLNVTVQLMLKVGDPYGYYDEITYWPLWSILECASALAFCCIITFRPLIALPRVKKILSPVFPCLFTGLEVPFVYVPPVGLPFAQSMSAFDPFADSNVIPLEEMPQRGSNTREASGPRSAFEASDRGVSPFTI